MLILNSLATGLSWLGRQGTRAVASLVFIGIALPTLGALLKPFVTEAIFVLLCIAFLRIDPAAFRGYVGRPTLVIAATVWTSLVIPGVFGIAGEVVGFKTHSPDLFLACLLQAIASPMMASPALAALMGLDATLVLTTLVTSTVLIPFTAPLFVHIFIGEGLALSPTVLGLRLLAILAGSACVGVIARRLFGPAAVERYRDAINGLNVLVLFVFVAVVMESVAAQTLAAPLITTGVGALALVVFLAVLSLTGLLFSWAGRERAVAIAFMASQRNMGLMLAAAGGVLPALAWLYFALSQFPIYLSPYLLQPPVRRLIARSRAAAKGTKDLGCDEQKSSLGWRGKE